MKAEIYQTLAEVNSGFEQIAASVKKLQENGIVSDRYAHKNSMKLAEISAAINIHVLTVLNARETEDKDHYGKMRFTAETQEQTA